MEGNNSKRQQFIQHEGWGRAWGHLNPPAAVWDESPVNYLSRCGHRNLTGRHKVTDNWMIFDAT